MDYSLLIQILYTSAPLLIGLLLASFKKLSLKRFQIIYLLLSALWLLIHSLFLPEINILKPIVIILLGEFLHILFIGFVGNKSTPRNIAALLIGVGLYPWYLSILSSFLYIVFIFIVLSIFVYLRLRKTKKEFNVSFHMKQDRIKKKLGDEKYNEYINRVTVLVARPLLISSIISLSILLIP